MSLEEREAIEAVAIDMWDPFIKVNRHHHRRARNDRLDAIGRGQ
jgi:hypothetical protein